MENFKFVVHGNKMLCYDGDKLIAIATNENEIWNSIDINEDTYDIQIVDETVRMYLVYENELNEFVINENEFTTHSLTFM